VDRKRSGLRASSSALAEARLSRAIRFRRGLRAVTTDISDRAKKALQAIRRRTTAKSSNTAASSVQGAADGGRQAGSAGGGRAGGRWSGVVVHGAAARGSGAGA